MSSTTVPIAEQLYVGLYCSDCACQTEQDEIVPLKNTTKLLKSLYQVELFFFSFAIQIILFIQEVESLKGELVFTRDSLRSSFYDELQANGQTM